MPSLTTLRVPASTRILALFRRWNTSPRAPVVISRTQDMPEKRGMTRRRTLFERAKCPLVLSLPSISLQVVTTVKTCTEHSTSQSSHALTLASPVHTVTTSVPSGQMAVYVAVDSNPHVWMIVSSATLFQSVVTEFGIVICQEEGIGKEGGNTA